MIIVVREINSVAVKQKIRCGSVPVAGYALRPYIYKHGAPAGTVYLQIQDSSGNKIKDSESITITAISAQNYFHGFYRFLVNFGFAADAEYYVEMKTSGYTYASNAYIGWANSWEIPNSMAKDFGPPNTGYSAPLGLQVWAYSHVTKGDY